MIDDETMGLPQACLIIQGQRDISYLGSVASPVDNGVNVIGNPCWPLVSSDSTSHTGASTVVVHPGSTSI